MDVPFALSDAFAGVSEAEGGVSTYESESVAISRAMQP